MPTHRSPSPPELAVVCGQLEAAATFPFKRIIFAVANQDLAYRSRVQIWPRLIMVMEGTRDISLPVRTGIERFHLVAGEAYYALSDSWEWYSWNTPLRLLLIGNCFSSMGVR